MDELYAPQANPEIERMYNALTWPNIKSAGYAMVPEYLKNTNPNPSFNPNEGGKIPQVNPNDLTSAPFATMDLVGGGGAKAGAGLGLKGAMFFGPGALMSGKNFDYKLGEKLLFTMNKDLERSNMRAIDKSNLINDELYRHTGLTVGADGMLRHEMPEEGLRFATTPMDKDKTITSLEGKLRDLYPEWNVLKEYPTLGDYNVKLNKVPGEPTGHNYFDTQLAIANAPNSRQLKNTMVHEMQHAIQKREGFQSGGSPASVIDWLVPKHARANLDDDTWNWVARSGFNTYKRLAGEVEARNAASRFDKNLYYEKPWLTEDVSRLNQIIPNEKAIEGDQLIQKIWDVVHGRAKP